MKSREAPRLVIAIAAAMAIALFGLAACAPGDTGPVDRPRRVVSLVPAATQVLFAIDAGERVVGVSSYDTSPSAVLALPRVGALLDPDTERILSLEPDLVVVDPSHRSLSRQLQQLGIVAFPWATGDLEGFYRQLRLLGEAVDSTEDAARLERDLRAELAAVAATVTGPRPRTLLVFGRRPGSFAGLWVSGGVGFLHELVEIAGGNNVFGDLTMPSFKAGLEVIVANPPAVVLETADQQEASSEAVAAEWTALPGFGDVTVGVIAGSDVLVPGPGMGETARAIAEVIRRSQDANREGS